MIFEQVPALLSGLFGSLISLRFGGNIKGGFIGAVENTFVTTLLTGVVVWFCLGWWFESDIVARFMAAVFCGVFSYPVFIGFVKLSKIFTKNPLSLLERFKK